MEVGIVGGGMMGLATAFYLARDGVKVTVFEKEQGLGGLSCSEEITPGLIWDRYYHVILTPDDKLLKFIEEIGLSSEVRFRETKTGFYMEGELHSISNIMEFLRFKPLSIVDKLRLGVGVLYASRIKDKDWKRLERLDAKTWLIRVFGHRIYEKLWDPLLRSKLGSAKEQASGSFIWTIIKRFYGTRHEGSKKEMMGCVRGGYHNIIKQTQKKLYERDVKIFSNHGVKTLEPLSNGKIRINCLNGKTFDFDKVIATIPSPDVIRIWPEIPDDFRFMLEKVRYLCLVCVTLVLKGSLTPFYVTNLADSELPFTGLIEATNVIPQGYFGTKALIYLPRYMPIDDPFYKSADEEVLNIFLNALRKIFPDFTDDDILASRVNRVLYDQPILEVDYSKNIPSMKTPMENFYMVNTTMILNSTLNNNQVIRLARKMADYLLNEQV